MTTRTLLITAALGAAAVAPTTALAAADRTPHLGGSPQMRSIDATHATVHFAADELPRTKAGKFDAGITIANGGRVTALKLVGRHGRDRTYTAKVTSSKAMREGATYTMTFRLGDSRRVTRKVKLYAPGEHG